MEKATEPGKSIKKPRALLVAIALIAGVVLLALAAIVICSFFSFLGSIDDPFRPQAPSYHYTADVAGLDGFTAENGSAAIMLPLPVVNGAPILSGGWWANYPPDPRERHHGMLRLGPANTSLGPMLEARINMTDYYLSEAGATPIAVFPGMGASAPPAVAPDRIDKPWSFDDVHVIASGSVQPLDYPTSAQGRAAVMRFLEAPLAPAENVNGPGDFTTYVYIGPELKPLRSDSALRVSGLLTVTLNHNKVNASEEGRRLFEYHNYAIDETIPGGVTGYVPVRVHYTICSGLNNCISRP